MENESAQNFIDNNELVVNQSIIDNINLLSKKCYLISKSKGFWDIDTEKEKLFREKIKNILINKYSSGYYLPDIIEEEVNFFIKEAKECGLLTNERNFGEFASLCHSEISEAVEAKRHGDPPDQHCPEFSSSEIELADTIIRIGDFAGANNLRLGEAIIAKLKYNQTRAYKHSKLF